jgi:hypothetical protein
MRSYPYKLAIHRQDIVRISPHVALCAAAFAAKDTRGEVLAFAFSLGGCITPKEIRLPSFPHAILLTLHLPLSPTYLFHLFSHFHFHTSNLVNSQ